MQLYQIAVNNLRRRKSKMVFVLLGLTIGIATMVSVYGLVEAMKTAMSRQAAEFGANVVLTPDAGELTFSYGGITLPAISYDMERLTNADVAAIDSIVSRDMIRAVAPRLLGLAALDSGQTLLVVGADLRQEFIIKPWLRLRDEVEMRQDQPGGGVSADGKEMLYERLDLAREDINRLVLGDNEILVGAALAAGLNVAEGDSLTLMGREFRIVSVLKDSGSAEDEQILMNLGAAQSTLNRPEEVTLIELAADYTLGSEEALIGQLKTAIPAANVVSLRQEVLRRSELITRLVRFGLSVSVLILLVGMLAAGLTMSGAVRERTREIGVLRALGFRKSHITKIILMEGVFISLLGGMSGYIAGITAARFAGPLLADMEIVVPWRFDLFVLAVVLAVFIGLSAGILPARQAARLDPAEALRFI